MGGLSSLTVLTARCLNGSMRLRAQRSRSTFVQLKMGTGRGSGHLPAVMPASQISKVAGRVRENAVW